MAQIELADLLAAYPPVESPDFQTLVTAKKEFSDLASSVTEVLPGGRGQLYRHQELIKRYMRIYDRLFLIHETGTGKTCSVVGFTEWVLDQRAKGGHIKTVYILCFGKVQKAEIRRQIVCNCSDGRYETEMVRNASDEAHQKSNITRELKKRYRIVTYNKFSKEISAGYPEEQDNARIAEDFADSVFWMDEVHNLRITPTASLKTNLEGNRLVYYNIWRVFHLARRSKFFISSATPIFNVPSDIWAPMNLILPTEMQIPYDFPFETATLEDLAPYFQGRISYVRALDTGISLEEQGSQHSNLFPSTYVEGGQKFERRFQVYATQMSTKQSAVYERVVSTIGNQDVYSAQHHVSNFIFPDDSYGSGMGTNAAFERYVITEGSDQFRATDELQRWLRDLETMRQLSSKFAAAVQICRDEPGNAFIYIELVHGSGAIVLGLCFEAMGFEKFTENSSIFIAKEGRRVKSFCSSTDTRRHVRPNFPKKRRYALISSESTDARNDAILEAMNSYENRHGEYIKVLIATRLAREGVNVNNVTQIHVISAPWNQAGAYQALSRAVRSTSHIDLIKERDTRLVVKIYKHVAFSSGGSSMDYDVYERAEGRDRVNRLVLRMMKQSAVDCQIHRTRNIRDTDVPGSPDCDYSTCNYPCSDPPPAGIDYSTFDVLYSGPLIDEVTDRLALLFQEEGSMTVERLTSILGEYRPKFILLALEQLVTNKIPLRDRFGFTAYLREDQGSFYLQRAYPITHNIDSISLDLYSYNLIGVEQQALPDVVLQIERSEQDAVIVQLQTMDPHSVEFKTLIDQLNLQMKVNLLEKSVFEMINGNVTPFYQGVHDAFKAFFYHLPEPVTEINKAIAAVSGQVRKRGRKPKPDTKRRIRKVHSDVKMVYDTDTEIVFLHTLYTQMLDRSAYSTTSRFNKADGLLRILKSSENRGWRDVNQIELGVYNTIIQLMQQEIKHEFEEAGIYGNILGDHKFRIVLFSEQPEDASRDARRQFRGKVCGTFTISSLIDIAVYLELPPPESVPDLRDKSEVIKILLALKINHTRSEMKEWTLKQLNAYHRWIRGKVHRDEICKMIEAKMRERGILREV